MSISILAIIYDPIDDDIESDYDDDNNNGNPFGDSIEEELSSFSNGEINGCHVQAGLRDKSKRGKTLRARTNIRLI